MKLGIFGGTFDPVHLGHLLLAETCLQHCPLDKVLFVPAMQSPHKLNVASSDIKHRIEMLKLAIAGHRQFDISLCEANRGGVSYTVDTLLDLHQEFGDDELFLLMGADSLVDFPKWKAPDEICRLATPIVVNRAGTPEPDLTPLVRLVSAERYEEIQRRQIEFARIEISSTRIRDLVSHGKSIRFQTPRAVEMYIESNGLYENSSSDDT